MGLFLKRINIEEEPKVNFSQAKKSSNTKVNPSTKKKLNKSKNRVPKNCEPIKICEPSYRRKPVNQPQPLPCNCDDCPTDPTLTCSYSGDEINVKDVYIANAYKGHLILTPGGAGGIIGGLLHELNPPQHYSHMGIMVRDLNLIRHCPGSQSRLNAKEYYTGDILGKPAPTDGLNDDHVRYGWPGSITQSIEQAFMADRYGSGKHLPNLTDSYKGADLPDMESSSNPKNAYTIDALSFDPVSDDGQTWFPALVVKPCPILENDYVKSALEHVADMAMQMYTHYRFYCYTNAVVGEVLDYQGPIQQMLNAQPESDTINPGKWIDWSDPSKLNWIKVPTMPAVCSSFVWQAVRMVNEKGSKLGWNKIHLDTVESPQEALGDAHGNCVRTIAPDYLGDVTDPYTIDGLYFYDAESRKKAAKWLSDNISQQVYDSVKAGMPGVVQSALDIVGRTAFILAAAAGTAALGALLNPILGGALGAITLADLIEWLYDMPDDIANQMCNAFAFDCCRGFPGDTHCVDAKGNTIQVDSSNWADAPGVGRAVSPDNIHMFWDPPVIASTDGNWGLYGFNRPVALCVGVFRRPKCVLVKSTGTAIISGDVKYQGTVVEGAYVNASCYNTISRIVLNSNHYVPSFALQVKSGGQYKVVARWENPNNGKICYGEITTSTIQPNTNTYQVITLLDPPECMRNVIVKGWIRVDDVYLTGADHADEYPNKTLFVQSGVPVFDQKNGVWICDMSDANNTRLEDVARDEASVGDVVGRLEIDVKIRTSDLSVDVKLTGTLNPDDDNMQKTVTVNVAKDQVVSVPEFDLDNGGSFNDRAYFRNITIQNKAAQAI